MDKIQSQIQALFNEFWHMYPVAYTATASEIQRVHDYHAFEREVMKCQSTYTVEKISNDLILSARKYSLECSNKEIDEIIPISVFIGDGKFVKYFYLQEE